MPIISFASSKGGAGKTTSAIVLGTELAASGTTVIMLDADPAARLENWSTLANLPVNITAVKSKGEKYILDEIEESATKAAFVLIDLEGSASRLGSYAIGESDLVIIPSGEEQQDADASVETLAEVTREGRTRRRDISAAILLCRTNAAVKSRLEKHIQMQLKTVAPVFDVQLHRRTAFSALHNVGAGLRQMDPAEFNGIDKAIANAQSFAAEVIDRLDRKGTTQDAT